MSEPTGEMLLDVRGVRKHFGGQQALDGVDFDLRRGEIHALLGENGAGKSTLIKILAGVHARDDGEIDVLETALPQHFTSAEAIARGLAFVHQDLGLIDELTVAENVALECGFTTRGRLISYRKTERRVDEMLQRLGVDVSSRTPLGQLSQPEQVMVAVARAFALDARAIVLDEVGSSLPAPDVERLGEILRGARAAGIGFVYVTHRLNEIFGLADRVTVLRDGKRVATADVADVDHTQVVEWIVGSALPERISASTRERAAALLDVRRLNGPGLADPLSFSVAPGEVVAFCGLVGCGAGSVARLLGGAAVPTGGEATLGGERLALGRPATLARQRCSFVPGDRSREGVFADLFVRENLFVSRRLRTDKAFRLPGGERRTAQQLVDQFGVKPTDCSERPIATLSGGNQQKVVVGRALRAEPSLLVLENPTAGVDVGSRADLYELLNAARARGAAIVLASDDYEEVAAEADRAFVMFEGRPVAEFESEQITPDTLARASYGSITTVTAA